MRLLFDQNLSWKLPKLLVDIFPDSLHVRSVDMKQVPDSEIVAYARREQLVIVTKDSGLKRWASVNPGSPKIVWVRVGNCSTRIVEELLRHHSLRISELVKNPQLTSISVF